MTIKLKNFLPFFLVLAIGTLIAVCLYFFSEYRSTDNALKKLGTKTMVELRALMAKEREIIRKNTAEQYCSEMILYEKTAISVQEEKTKLRKLQSRIKR